MAYLSGDGPSTEAYDAYWLVSHGQPVEPARLRTVRLVRDLVVEYERAAHETDSTPMIALADMLGLTMKSDDGGQPSARLREELQRLADG